MAAIVWADVTGWDAGLTTVSSTAQTDILAYVNTTHKVSEFPDGESGTALRLARIYLAAHMGRMQKQPGATAGAVTGESAGGLSRSYASPSDMTAELMTTKWGREYLRITRNLPARVGFVI